MDIWFESDSPCKHNGRYYEVWRVYDEPADATERLPIGMIHEYPDGRWQMHVLRGPGEPRVLRTWHETLAEAKAAHRRHFGERLL